MADVVRFDDLEAIPRAMAAAELTGSANLVRHPLHGISYSGTVAARIGPGHDIPAAEVELSASGNLARVSVARLEATSDDLRVHFVGDLELDPLAPRGMVTVDTPSLLAGRRMTHIQFAVAPDEGGVQLTGESLQFGDVAARSFGAGVWPDAAQPRRLDFQARGEIEQDGANSVSAAGTLDLTAGVDLSFSSQVSGIAAAALYRLAVAPEQRQPWLAAGVDALLVNADLAGSTDLASIAFEHSVVQLVDKRDGSSPARVRLDRDRGAWLVEGAAAEWRGLRVHADATVTPVGNGLQAVVDLTVDDQPHEVSVAYRPGDGITAGSSRFQLDADFSSSGGISFRGSVTDLPIPASLSPAPIRVSAAFDGTATSATEWSLSSDAVTLDGVPLLDRRAQVEFGLHATPDGAALEQIALRAGSMVLAGSGRLTYGAAEDPVAARLTLAGADERERYALTLTIDQHALSADAEIAGMPLERLGDLPVSGRLRARLTASGPPQDLTWSAAIALDEGRFNDETVSLSADVAFASGNLSVWNLALELLGHRLRGGSVTYDRAGGSARFGADFETEFLGDPVAARLALSVDNLQVTEAGGWGDALAAGVHATLRASEVQVAGTSADPWQVRLSSVGTAEPRRTDASAPHSVAEPPSADAPATGNEPAFVIRFAGGPHEAFDGFVSTDGQFRIRVNGGPYPLRATAAGSYADGRVVADVSLADLDARVIGAALAGAPISLQSGTASGTVRVAGTLNDPDFWGTIRLTGGTLTSQLVPQVIGPFTVEFTLDEKQAAISRFVSETSDPLPVAVRGDVTLERYAPTAYRLELTTYGQNGLTVDYRFGPVFVDAQVTGDLAITGHGEDVTLAGEVRAVSGDISLGEFSADAPPVGTTQVDVTLVTGRSVEFTWPRAQFPIVRATLEPEQHVRIRYDGVTGGFSVDGDVGARSGDLFYFDRQFRLREGHIRLAETERGFDPRLRVRAETRERDAAGEPVRIILHADTRLSELGPATVHLSSDPARSALALDAMVRDTVTGQNERIAGGAGTAAAAFSGDLLAQNAMLRPLERALRAVLGVDMVGIRSPFVQNLMHDGLDSRQAPSFGNPFDNTSLSVGKYFGSDLFLSMLLRLDTSPDEPFREPALLSDLELNLEWSTPFFLLEWSLLPRDANTLFLTDVAITLSWRWRY
ncbi:MAG: translocation/assembly module TamB domain-containing protein [Spirochaetaceae bacterium]|nr:translocation/assembly module TamB domain-containing protein [Spirochaetaceae bacterium]